MCEGVGIIAIVITLHLKSVSTVQYSVLIAVGDYSVHIVTNMPFNNVKFT